MLAVAGVSYKTAPVEVRERIAFATDGLLELLPPLRAQFGPSVVLSTCNRTEVYLSEGEATLDVGALASFIAGQRGFAAPVEADHFYTLAGSAAVGHLYRVAAGLDSMVLGESQILGQVRDALRVAARAGTADGLLTRLFQTAVGAGRRTRNRSGMPGTAASISAAAVELSRRTIGDLSRRSVLVVSTGETGKLMAWNLARSGVERIAIASRTLARARKIADQMGATPVSMSRLSEAMREVDIVVSATGAREFCIDRPLVASAMAGRPNRPLLMIDLAVPRDIDPLVGQIVNVRLHDIDDLQPLMDETLLDSRATVDEAEVVIADEVQRFLAWWEGRSVVPAIAALRHRAEGIRRHEVAKTLGRLPNLSSTERARIEALTSAIINKLLHEPIMCLKESADQPAHLNAFRELFALDPLI